MHRKDIWVGRLLIITCSISKQISLLFSKTISYTFKHLTNLKIFSKDQHLCIHSNKQESLQRFPKQWPLYKILSKTTQSSFSKQTSLLFLKQSHTLSNILQTWKHFQKINIFVYILTNENHYKDCLKQWPLYKILSKTIQSTISNKKQVI